MSITNLKIYKYFIRLLEMFYSYCSKLWYIIEYNICASVFGRFRQQRGSIPVKFRTKLGITALSMILVPFLLTIVAFLVIGSRIEDAEAGILDRDSASYT